MVSRDSIRMSRKRREISRIIKDAGLSFKISSSEIRNISGLEITAEELLANMIRRRKILDENLVKYGFSGLISDISNPQTLNDLLHSSVAYGADILEVCIDRNMRMKKRVSTVTDILEREGVDHIKVTPSAIRWIVQTARQDLREDQYRREEKEREKIESNIRKTVDKRLG